MFLLFIRSVGNEIKGSERKHEVGVEKGFKDRIPLNKNRNKWVGTEFGHMLRRKGDTPHIVSND